MTPEIVRRQEGKSRGGSTRNPHRGKLQRTPSQTSLSSDEGDGGRKNPPGDGKKIHMSMERLQEMEQREKLYLAKIEDLTTRLKIYKIYFKSIYLYFAGELYLFEVFM